MPPSPPTDDAALVQRCRQGDGAAWAVLVQRYQRIVYAVALHSGADEHGAADIFQTVFARLLEQVHKLTQPERLQAWLVTTAKREALLVRHRSRRTVSLTRPEEDGGGSLADELPDNAPLAEAALEQLQQLALLRAGLDRLDERCRSLLELLFHDEDEQPGYTEVAARLLIPIGSIGPTRARCLAKLRRLVEEGAQND